MAFSISSLKKQQLQQLRSLTDLTDKLFPSCERQKIFAMKKSETT